MGKTRDSANLVSDNNIKVDIINDRVGIGTSTPAYDLDVVGNVNFSGTLYQNGGPFTVSSVPYATVAGYSTSSGISTTATYATTAGIATYASTSGISTNATNATNVSITNNTSTNATYYPTFVTSTSGNQPQTVSSSKLTFNPSTGRLTSTELYDSSGSLRTLPQISTTSRTLVATDTGKHISATSTITVPYNVFTTGDVVTIYNNSSSSITISQGSSVTLRQSGTSNTGNRTLAQYGVATILCVAGSTSSVFVISGSGLT
jgi:hypothetical protein